MTYLQASLELNWLNISRHRHCVKSFQIQSNFWSVFSHIWTEYEVSLRIQSQCGKMRTRNYSVFGHFLRSEMGEVSITPPPGIGLTKSKSLSFVSKEKFLKTAGVKSNHENMMESNDGMFFYHGSKNEGTSFLGDSLNKNISRKKIMRLFNEQSSSHFEVFWKTSASKTYKSSHQEVFSK